MAVDPSQAPKTEKRFFDNESTTLLRLEDPRAYLIQSASRIVKDCPPKLPWAAQFAKGSYRGFFRGPTSIAYFFLALSSRHPDLEIHSQKPIDWCKLYLDLGQNTTAPLLDTTCGISNEYLAFNTLKACAYQSESHAILILDALRNLGTDPTYCEWFNGRAGALCILRILRQGFPHMAEAINTVITTLIESILPQQPWSWNNIQYLGPAHGDIGIVTQIVLSDPSYAPKLESKLLSLLKLQDKEGNWHIIEGKDLGLVQFCHGAPGFVLSLVAIRPYFPTLYTQIDAAIALGRKLIWEKGILRKEPNICHGITGNALALEIEKRDHFLCMATPEKIDEGIKNGLFEKDEDAFGALWGETGRAWVWMEVLDGREGRCMLYTDV